jgi:serine/threonine-protein kinase RsbW
VSEKKRELNLPSRLESVEAAATEAERFATQNGFDEEVRSAIDMAVREAVANAVKHGNLLDETKSVEITFENRSEGFEITVRDFGEGFAVEEIPDPTHPENILKASGRGILFMRSFMDTVEWSNHAQGGMIVKMLKKR